MKIPKEPVSAFSVYSEKLKQKKKRKIPSANGVSKIKKKAGKIEDMSQVNEITGIMQALAEQSSRFGKHIPSTNSSITSVENIPKVSTKPKERVTKKSKDKHITRNSSNKNKELLEFAPNKKNKQAEPDKLKIQILPPEGCKSQEEAMMLESTSNKKLNPEDHKMYLKLKKYKQNLLNQEKNTMLLPNSDKKVKTKNSKQGNLKVKTQYVSEDKLSNEKGFKGDSTLNKKEFPIKLRKKKGRKVGQNDWSTQENSAPAAKRLFEWLTLPIPETDFMRDFWEKQPLLVQRQGNRNYFSELISTLEIDSMLRKNNVQFTKHLDVTSYTEEGRETHNLSGRAQANVVWDFYTNGCSVRLLNPQAFLPKIHTLNSTLQGYFGCFVGANVYLTPPNSQGFAPHYDDIEAFVLQIEGKKHWKVYQPRSEGETLPRYSSPNFTQQEIGQPILDVTLEPGDMLYFPRGYIHQASTVEGKHSLHITLSAYQKTAWVDLLQKAIPIALERAAAEDVEFRRGLPRDYLGIEFQGCDEAKKSFTDTAQRLMAKVARIFQYSLGAGVDRMGAQFMHDALPPAFTPGEKQTSVLGGGLKMKEGGKLAGRVEFQLETEIKLVRGNICRMVEEEGELRLYHCLDNPLEYHAEDPQFLVLPPEGGQVITHLSTCYPGFVQLQTIPHVDDDALLTLVSDLWDSGLLNTRGLTTVDEDD